MRIKTLLCGTLATLMALCCVFDSPAQKKSTGKRTTTTKSAVRSTTSKSTGPAIAADFLVGKSYSLYHLFSDDNMYMFANVDFQPNNEVTMDYAYTDLIGNWKVSGNKVTITTDKSICSLSSNDGGIMFKGTRTSTGKPNEAIMYSTGCRDLKDLANKESWLKALKNDQYIAWLRYYFINDELYFANPAKVKFVEDEDNPYQGTLKITGDGKLMEFLGSFKSEYSFGENGLTVHFNDYKPDERCTSKYSDNCGGYFCVKLGTKKIPGRGNAIIYLDFYHK